MRVSRAPEKRGRGKKPLVYYSLVGTTLILAAVFVYFIGGFDAPLAMVTQSDESQSPAGSATGITELLSSPSPTAIPRPAPTPIPAVAIKLLEAEPEPLPRTVPQVQFGEELDQGLVQLALPANHLVDTWYTFQVNTSTGDITLFFALYDDFLPNPLGTVKVQHYAQGSMLDNAEITLSYPNAPDRLLTFDGSTGMMSLVQQQDWQPYSPSLLTLDLRVALVEQDIRLQDETGDTQAVLQLDLTGLSNSEEIKYQRLAPDVVEDVLLEIQLLVDQIESKRIKQ